MKVVEKLFDVLRPRGLVKACLLREGNSDGWVRAEVRLDGMKPELRCVEPHKDDGQIERLPWRAG